MGLKISRTASMLLSDESKSKAKKYKEIRYIRRDRIHKNPKNKVSIDGIEELAQDIRLAGIEQPLVGYAMETGDIMLLTGERRLTAIDKLIEDGAWDPENDLIPFVIVSLADYDLPLDDDLKERYAILRTNAFNRILTDADKVVQAEDYKVIIKALKKQGYKEMIIGYDDNGDPVSKDISGRTREVVAGMMGISTGQMGKIESIEKHGGDKLKEAVKSGGMSIAAASALSRYPEEDQDVFLDNEDLSSATASSVTEAMENDKWKEMDAASEFSQTVETNVKEMENKDNSFLPVQRSEAYELEHNENAVLDFAEELMNNIRKRDWESALSNLGELEEMLRVLLENDQ